MFWYVLNVLFLAFEDSSPIFQVLSFLKKVLGSIFQALGLNLGCMRGKLKAW